MLSCLKDQKPLVVVLIVVESSSFLEFSERGKLVFLACCSGHAFFICNIKICVK